METFDVPGILRNSDQKLIRSEETTIVSYNQNEEVEKANVQLSQHLIVFVVRGYKHVLGDQHNINIRKGQGFFMRKGNYLMSEKFANGKNYRSFLFFFTDDFVHQFSNEHAELISESDSSLNHMSTFSTNASITAFLSGLQTYFDNPDMLDCQSWAKLKLNELFLLLSNSRDGEYFFHFLKQLKTTPAQKLREVMNLHYKENLNLEQYAFLAGYSLSTFKRRFKEEFGTTPGKWIKLKRLQEAKFLLHSTRQNVSQICFEVGFENISHFVQSFKEQYGITPKQFQLEHSDT